MTRTATSTSTRSTRHLGARLAGVVADIRHGQRRLLEVNRPHVSKVPSRSGR